MRRLVLITTLLASVVVSAGVLQTATNAGSVPRPNPPQLLAFRGHFGGFHLSRGGGFGQRRFGAGRFGRNRSLFHRIARALAFAYLLHLFFSHGGISILLWILVIGLVIHFIRRRGRRRRDRYAY